MFGSGQFSAEILSVDIWYYLAAFMTLIAVAALSFLDLGLVRKENQLHSAVQKMASILAGGFGMMLIGYPIWYWQFNQAFGVPHPLLQAIHDWWFAGDVVSTVATKLDPTAFPEADVLQIFFVFFVAFGMLGGALLHGALSERVKTVPLVIISILVNGLLQPLVAYLCWGSMGPLSNIGFHDYAAISSVYLAIGTFTIAVNLMIRPRIGRFTPHASGVAPTQNNPTTALFGVLVLMGAIPFIMVGNGYFIIDKGFYGISFASSGLGIMASNLILAFVGGGVSGLLIAARRREYSWALYGPLAGYVVTGTLLDIGKPWQTFIVALFGPPLMLLGHLILEKLRIDDAKASLAVLPGGVGILITGFIGWGTKQGGYPGLKGEYGFQAHELTPWIQLLGVVIVIIGAFAAGLLISWILKHTTGLRLTEEAELQQDAHHWNYPAAVVDAREPHAVRLTSTEDDLDRGTAPVVS